MPELKTGAPLARAVELDLKKTFECGQCFRWDADENGAYSGAACGKPLRIWADAENVYCDAPESALPFWRTYFDLGADYDKNARPFTGPEYLRACYEFGKGIRILRQEPWEALASFIISQCNNIPRIKKIISALCAAFGEALPGGMFAFPPAERLAPLAPGDLAPLKSGYRAAYILNAARAVADGSLNFNALRALPPEEAFLQVRQIRGVGDKVANCFMLYGLHSLDRFPVDVWMKRALARHFPKDFDPKNLGPCAGLAQQYIFYYARSGGRNNGFARA
ncbi:MAG: DNA-3-methyladenine glycosylase 2 family protein [Oscillospiraceae bacterium]|jgi:N-glycosylase/DNA lyase|nr:DNA-3-methyladenine glycosylase 2 family protein [Oscillospiraceae bacterium]